MLFSPQQSGVAKKESIDVIFRESSSDSMELYNTSRSEKQREKASLHLISLRSLLKIFKVAPVRVMLLI